jgi:hypothetical protein
MEIITAATTRLQDAVREKRKDEGSHKRLKRRRLGSRKHNADLTCSEDQVEALLSIGESTETA